MLSPQQLLRKNCWKTNVCLQAFFSRRSNNNRNDDVYKLVRARNFDELNSSYLGGSPNWELLAPKGYRFYMPGSIGPAWHDESTVAYVEQCFHDKKPSSKKNISFDYSVEECPILLREGVLELFQGLDASTHHITVITIHQKYVGCHQYSQDFDELAKRFVLAAQDVCTRLKVAGYWADFINPFSGRPNHTPLHGGTLYKTDERFRCLGFMIKKHADCKVISNSNEKKTFVGSLFTTVPADSSLFQEIFEAKKQ